MRYLGAATILGEWRARETFNRAISINGASGDVAKCVKHAAAVQRSIRKMECDFEVYMEEEDLSELKKEAGLNTARSCEEKERALELEYRPKHVKVDHKAFLNLTELDVPEDVVLALSWGPKFTFPFVLNKHNICKYLAQLEAAVEATIPIATYDVANREISQHLLSIDDAVYNHDIQWLLFLRFRLDSFLKGNVEVKPVLADKGKIVVLMSVLEYEGRIIEHLSDSRYYLEVDQDPLGDLVKTEKELIGLLKVNQATGDMVGAYQHECMTLPKFYATVKIHKQNAIRPITSCAGNTVGAVLNRVFNELLTVVFPPSERHCSNALDLKRRIGGIKLTAADVLVSFDAVSMFTSIPASLIIDILRTRMPMFYAAFKLEESVVLRMAHYLLYECTFFTAVGRTFRQTHGLPMGGAISPICCRLVMDHIIERTLTKIPTPIFHNVYVDDTVFILERENVALTLDALNEVNPNIVFTVELENNDRLNFLNLTLHRFDGGVITNWFKKDIASNRLLNYYSSHKRSTIMNTAVQFICTVLSLSDADYFGHNREIIEQTLIDNCFPEDVRIALLHTNYTLMKPQARSHKKLNSQYVSFPHQMMNGSVKAIIRQYKDSDAVLAESIRNNKINHIRNIKTRTPNEKRTNLIIQATCQCRLKMRIEMTGFNQTGEMLRDKILNDDGGKGCCTDSHHIFSRVKYVKGLQNLSQTRYYLRHLTFKYREMLDGIPHGFPNRHLRRVVEGFDRRFGQAGDNDDSK